MDDARSEHPDEGTIHAWLDGALDDATSQALAAHVAACRECAERVAEARGLIAGASRVVSALDEQPSATGPAWGRAPATPITPIAATGGAGGAWRKLRVTPARAAIAATVLVALGVSLTYRHTANTEAMRAMRGGDAAQMSSAREERAAAAPMAPPHDAVLDSAVARNLAAAQPRRVLKAAPGPEIPVPEAGAAGAVVADSAAPTRVAVGRAAMKAQRESTAGTTPDQLMPRRVAGSAVSTRAAVEPTVAAAMRADSVASLPIGVEAGSAPVGQRRVSAAVSAPECYRVESANGVAARWGPVALPLVVAVDAGGRGARVLTPAGQPTDASASVARVGEDSLLFRLRRLGYEGTLALGAAGETRAGVMRSRPSEMQLGETVTTGVGSKADAPAAAPAARRARARVPVSAGVTAAPVAAAPDSESAAAVSSAVTAQPAVPVVARRISCPR